MTRSEKRTAEIELAKLAARRIPGLRSATISPLDPPEPDCRLSLPNITVGLEVTECRGSQALRHAEAAQELVVAAANRIAIDLPGPGATVGVTWRNGFVPRRRDELAKRLVECVQSTQLKGRRTLVPTQHALEGILDFSIFQTAASGYLFFSVWQWSAGLLTFEQIQAEIARKSSRPRLYKNSYTERWLLLVYGGRGPSHGADVSTSVLRRRYETTFDRVYFYCLAPPFLRRLPTRRV